MGIQDQVAAWKSAPERWPARAHNRVVAHRGASAVAPESTVEAVERAIEMGAAMVEFDVRRTSDGVLIAHHDEVFDGIHVGTMTFGDMTVSQARTPTRVADILQTARGRVSLDIELKEPGYEGDVLEMLDGYLSPSEYVLTSFLDSAITSVKRARAGVRTGLLLGTGGTGSALSDLYPVARATRCGADFIAPHYRLTDLGVVARAARHGTQSFVWTVNDARRIETYLRDPRIAGVITDHPNLACDILARTRQ